MLLQIGLLQVLILLLFYCSKNWLQHWILAARDTLIGGYLHRPVWGNILWYWWSWSEGVWKFL